MFENKVLYATGPGTPNLGGRSFPGFSNATDVYHHRLSPRDAEKVRMAEGDLLSFSRSDGLCFMAFDAGGADGLKHLGLTASGTLDWDSFDADRLRGWCAGRGLQNSELNICSVDNGMELLVLKAAAPVVVWVIRPVTTHSHVGAQGLGTLWFAHKPAATRGPLLPEPFGDVRDEFTVQTGTARAYEVKAGDIVQVIDVEGQQCSDFMALRADALANGVERLIDSTATRSMVRRSYPGPGLLDKFFDRDLRPLMQVVQDTCGRHDTFGLACTARGYEERGFPGHVNCSDNMSHALSPHGVAARAGWPAINFFWNTWVEEQNAHLMTAESYSRAGDYVAMRALEDLVCVSTACPDELDPINGWNPTDVHVRIYNPEPKLQRAVAYREKEDAPMTLSTESAFHGATSKLTQSFAPARDLWMPTEYPGYGMLGEYWACREKATLQDMSGLRKYDIIGPDAERFLNYVMTKDVSRLAQWRGNYSLICDELGTVVDDGTLFRLAPEIFRWCCGTEESGRALETHAKEMNLNVRIHALGNTLPNLALQGPLSRDILRKVTFTQPTVPHLDHVKWFGATMARLNDRDGVPFMLTRSGYTGELGYEIFCARDHATEMWDTLMAAGEDDGLTPMGSHALGVIRIEAGLAAAEAEFAPEIDAWESGLGFAVDMRKPNFVGRAALERNARDPRRVLKGLMFETDDVPHHGHPIWIGERKVGQVTSAVRSPMFDCAIAMARLAVEYSEVGAKVEVGQMDGRMKRLPATVCDIPFVDPTRSRARA